MIRIINDKTGQVKFVSEAVAKSGYLKSYGYRIEDLNLNHSKIQEKIESKEDIVIKDMVFDTPEGTLEIKGQTIEKKKPGRPKLTDN